MTKIAIMAHIKTPRGTPRPISSLVGDTAGDDGEVVEKLRADETATARLADLLVTLKQIDIQGLHTPDD